MKGYFSSILLFFSIIYAHNFDPTAVSLLDQKNNSYLFRGSLPLFNSDREARFAYQELIATCEKCVGHPFPPNIELNVICLLNSIRENREIQAEKDFFVQHPDLGCFIHHSVFGSLINPNWISQEKIYHLVHRYSSSLNHLEYLENLLHNLLHSNTNRHKVKLIYIHCLAGHDRTGLVSSGYLMRFKSASFEEVKNINKQIIKREMQILSNNEMRWYAYYLKHVKHKPIGTID